MDYFIIVKKKILAQLDSEEYEQAYKETEQGLVDKNHCLEVVELTTQFWEELEQSNIPEALKIAALVHDSDRYYPKREVNTKNLPKEHYEYRKGIHAGNTALIFFENNKDDLPLTLIRDVCHLILRHERGGDKDKNHDLMNKTDEYTNTYNLNKAADILYYADKTSFFTSNIYEYKNRGKKRLKEKILYSTKDLPEKIKQKIFNKRYEDKIIQEVIKEVEQVQQS